MYLKYGYPQSRTQEPGLSIWPGTRVPDNHVFFNTFLKNWNLSAVYTKQ